MIIKKEAETLASVKGTDRINLYDIVGKAEEMSKNWIDHTALHTADFPFVLTDDCKLSFVSDEEYTQDISEYAFGQLCSKVGIPANYIQRCFDSGKKDLAIQNYRDWAASQEARNRNFLVRSYKGVTEAILTDKYNVFGSDLVLGAIRDAVMDQDYAGRYEANQIYLSQDRLHVRFVDFNNPLNVGGDELYSGFTVSSSDIGAGSLSIKYFLYRFACKNGIVYVKNGGVLFRQTHLNDFADAGKYLFIDALEKIDSINATVVSNIDAAAKKKLSKDELDMYLAKAQKELHIGRKGRESLQNLIGTTYDRTLWGLINSVTENAQNAKGLDRRIEAETWAGKLLAAA